MSARLLLTLLLVNKALTPAASPTPLLLTVRQTVGLAPLTLRVKVKAVEGGGKEVCVVVEGPESWRSCRTLSGVTWTLDFTLRSGGDYAVWAASDRYRTPDVPVRVIGLEGQQL